jgi:solute carrier family 35 protein
MISFGVIGYTVASATLLLLNKLAIHHLQAPSIILTLQLFSCAVSVRAAGAAGYCVVDELEWGKIRAFGTASFTFVILIFTNIKTLQHANVETFIVFRTSTPVLISVGEWMFLGRELPTARNWVCLVLLVGGASAYVATDQAFDPYAGYRWVTLWYVVFVFDQLYIKHVISTVPMASNWGRVYYNNLLALAPLLATGAVTDELTVFRQHSSAVGLGWCMASCVAGTGMSYFSFR